MPNYDISGQSEMQYMAAKLNLGDFVNRFPDLSRDLSHQQYITTRHCIQHAKSLSTVALSLQGIVAISTFNR